MTCVGNKLISHFVFVLDSATLLVTAVGKEPNVASH